MTNLTQEQRTIVDHVASDKGLGLTLVNACAGAGKTTLLVAIANSIPHTNALYQAYNSAIATSSTKKFPSTTDCRTTHSLAFKFTVVPLRLKVGLFNYKSITEKLTYDQKLYFLDIFREYCLSSFLSFSDFITNREYDKRFTPIGIKYLGLMQSGAIECTHDFYLKLFHLMLASGDITFPDFDFIMLDEAGDLNPVTIEIFRLLPSQRKIAVGDPFQNIYTFNHTVNCFEVLRSEGTIFPMSQSFRVSDQIAPRIQTFCQTYLDPNMSFIGTPITNPTIIHRAYLTRTNSALIDRMIELNDQSIPYGLVRKASEIFKLPLMLCSIKYQGTISDPNYRFLQADIDDWYDYDNLRQAYRSPLSYIGSLYKDDFQLQQALRLIGKHGKSAIFSNYAIAKEHESSNHNYLLMTVHSSKGLEADEVTIANDLNQSINDLLYEIKFARRPLSSLTPAERESLNLYYVAVTRASKSLLNAVHLDYVPTIPSYLQD